MNRAGTAQAVHASFNFFPVFSSIPGVPQRCNLDGISMNIQEKTPPFTSGCKVNANRLYWYNDVVIASVHSEKTRVKKWIMIIIIIITEKPFTSK